MGHSVTVLTGTLEPMSSDSQSPYRIVRTSNQREITSLIRQHDVVHAVGAFADCFMGARQSGKPFSWTHQSYRLVALDGLGWCDGGPAPLDLYQSYEFYRERIGIVKAAIGAAKCYGRALVAQNVDANVAITEHVSRRQPLPRQRVIYNPVNIDNFAVDGLDEAFSNMKNADCTFAYVGRLVSEKGVEYLLRAFALLIGNYPEFSSTTLKIIGDGPERSALEALASQLMIADQVRFVGALTGKPLVAAVHSAGIFVLPSAWEEAMGIVVVELMAAGKPLIVSAIGGLSECAGDACLTFQNRDSEMLAKAMYELASSTQRQQQLVTVGLSRARNFDVQHIAAQYATLFEELLQRKTH